MVPEGQCDLEAEVITQNALLWQGVALLLWRRNVPVQAQRS